MLLFFLHILNVCPFLSCTYQSQASPYSFVVQEFQVVSLKVKESSNQCKQQSQSQGARIVSGSKYSDLPKSIKVWNCCYFFFMQIVTAFKIYIYYALYLSMQIIFAVYSYIKIFTPVLFCLLCPLSAGEFRTGQFLNNF